MTLVQAIVDHWTVFWNAHADEAANDRVELRECLGELGAKFGDDVRSVGPVRVMAAMFVAQEGPGLEGGAEGATAFIWSRMAYRDWVEVTRLVLEDAHAWYGLMWFCHRYLRIEFSAVLREHSLAPEARIASMERHRPSQITLVAVPDEETPEHEVIEAAGVDPYQFWRSLREEGASRGSIDELSH